MEPKSLDIDEEGSASKTAGLPNLPDWDESKDLELVIYGLVPDSIVDGPGLRYGVFVQGCPHRCPGCHNPESQPFNGGTVYKLSQIWDSISGNKLITGVTFSGGEPFEQAGGCAVLARKLKESGYNIWAYSGYRLEDLLDKAKEDAEIDAFLRSIDVLVDGPFLKDRHSYELKWRGSSNQRIIDMPATLRSGSVVEWIAPAMDFAPPPSW